MKCLLKKTLAANEKTEIIRNILKNPVTSCVCILQEEFRHPYIQLHVFIPNSPDGLQQPDYVLALTAARGSEGGHESDAQPRN